MKKIAIFSLGAFLIATILIASKGEEKKTVETSLAEKKSVLPNNEENFRRMMDVLTSARCVNCHPNDNVPKQGDDSHPHYFGMRGGKDNLGYDATKCTTCHQSENNNFSGVPGAPGWSLAPAKMKWEGLTRVEIARSMLNRENNGNRSLKELEHHLTEHELVLWAWNPGVDANGNERTKPPVPLDEYREAVKKWIEDGAVIPEE